MKRIFDLIPDNGRKSFYGKAKVIEHDNGIVSLMSYNTVVCSIDTKSKSFYRHWAGYSLTTMQHINTFRRCYGMKTLSRCQWYCYDTVSYNQ